MTRTLLSIIAGAALLFAAETYTLGPDSQRKPGVPQGTVTQYQWSSSKVFPGTVRKYWVYTPAGVDRSKPLPVMIFQDGGNWVSEDSRFRANIVLDNLIAAKSIPPMLGIFVDPGVMPAPSAGQQARFNRSFEYDSTSDRYSRFLVDELLPEVAKTYNLSKDPNDRGLAGSSSGGIAAFVAAWHRPDQFRRVLSYVGSYTNLRGGNQLADLVRKMEQKPLRVFLQDGDHDQNIYSGNWWLANQQMSSALEYAGYETTFVRGTEGHNAKHGSAILPDALRWVWAGYPKPVGRMDNEKQVERHYIRQILDPASDWEVAYDGAAFADGPAADKGGNLYFAEVKTSVIRRLGADGKVTTFASDTGRARGLAFGADGRLYATSDRGVTVYDSSGKGVVVAGGVNANDLAVSSKGGVYFTETGAKKVWYAPPGGSGEKRAVVTEGIAAPNGVRLSADESLLLVADFGTRFVWSYQIQADGSVANGQPFYKLEIPEDPHPTRGVSAMADGMAVDTEGQLYVATEMGIQVCDQPGRVIGIIRRPSTAGLTNIAFGGPDRMTLYATAGEKVWKRRLRRVGAPPAKPVMPPKPRL